MNKWINYSIGYVFITSGILKLVISDFKIMFANLGLPFPAFTLFVIAIIELGCGMLIAGNMYLKYALFPLIVIMIGAIILTKLPILISSGILSFAFESRLDIVMLILLLFLWKQAGDKHKSPS